jgi:hypothetical protein
MKVDTENIMQRAEKALDYWDAGTMWARLIERDLDANDIEALEFHLKEAESEMEVMRNAEKSAKAFDMFVLGGVNLDILNNLPRVSMPEGFGERQT